MPEEPRNPPLRGLRERRIFRRLNQQHLAEVIGVTQSHYRQFEVGNVRLDVHRALLLARVLNCSIEELV